MVYFSHLLCFYIVVGLLSSDVKLQSTPRTNKKGEIKCEHGTLLSKSICIPKAYRKGEVPEIPTVVNFRLEIKTIRSVDDKQMRVTLEIYQESLWIDDRVLTSLRANEIAVLNNNMIDSLWKPDLWIKNLFDFKIHSILEPTGGLMIMNNEFCENEILSLRTVRNGFGLKNCTKDGSKHQRHTLIMYNMEAQVELHCNFHFEKYPMDTQHCEFLMNSSYPDPNIVHLLFEQGQFGITNNNVNLDDFKIGATFEDKHTQMGVRVIIKLERCILPFIIRYYLPCMAIAVVSLINFCIPIECVPARVTLLVTQFLTLTNILIAQQVRVYCL